MERQDRCLIGFLPPPITTFFAEAVSQIKLNIKSLLSKAAPKLVHWCQVLRSQNSCKPTKAGRVKDFKRGVMKYPPDAGFVTKYGQKLST